MKKYDQHKIKRGVIRKDQLDAGYFDGRFVERSIESKKKYSRTRKHKTRLD